MSFVVCFHFGNARYSKIPVKTGVKAKFLQIVISLYLNLLRCSLCHQKYLKKHKPFCQELFA
jgi:hypothetical protein